MCFCKTARKENRSKNVVTIVKPVSKHGVEYWLTWQMRDRRIKSVHYLSEASIFQSREACFSQIGTFR